MVYPEFGNYDVKCICLELSIILNGFDRQNRAMWYVILCSELAIKDCSFLNPWEYLQHIGTWELQITSDLNFASTSPSSKGY